MTHDTSGVTTVSDLTLADVNRPEAVDQLLAQAMEKRYGGRGPAGVSAGLVQVRDRTSRRHPA